MFLDHVLVIYSQQLSSFVCLFPSHRTEEWFQPPPHELTLSGAADAGLEGVGGGGGGGGLALRHPGLQQPPAQLPRPEVGAGEAAAEAGEARRQLQRRGQRGHQLRLGLLAGHEASCDWLVGVTWAGAHL